MTKKEYKEYLKEELEDIDKTEEMLEESAKNIKSNIFVDNEVIAHYNIYFLELKKYKLSLLKELMKYE